MRAKEAGAAWPKWCFFPLGRAIELCALKYRQPQPYLPFALEALAAWRVTQGVYRFDEDLFAELIQTPLSGDLPKEVLFGLPEWCVYIETPGIFWAQQPVYGFFAHLGFDLKEKREELRLVLDMGSLADLAPLVLHLGPWSLRESIERAVEEVRNSKRYEPVFAEQFVETLQRLAAPMLSLLLYLCSANADIDPNWRHRSLPQPKRIKGGEQRYFPPEVARVWEVGVRIGAALRAGRKAEEEATPEAGAQEHAGGARRRPRPHIRRAHWHGYWIGPKQDPRFELRWLPPMAVALESVEQLPAVVRPVR